MGGGKVLCNKDTEGVFRGTSCLYIYPGNDTFLKGEFVGREMVGAKLATFNDKGHHLDPASYDVMEHSPTYRRDISTDVIISSEPMLRDPHEEKIVEIRKSTISGDGVFAKRLVKKGNIIAYFNGVRFPIPEDDNYEGSVYSIQTIEYDIDIPADKVSISNYTASIGHKVNHSFQPNIEFVDFEHPRFGGIMAVKALRDIAEDEELTADYGMDIDEEDIPTWYREQYDAWKATTSTKTEL